MEQDIITLDEALAQKQVTQSNENQNILVTEGGETKSVHSPLVDLENRTTYLENFVAQAIGYYGVERPRKSGGDLLSTDPAFPTIIGREDIVQSHPVLADFHICKVLNGKVVDTVNDTDWTKLVNGKPSNVIIDGVSVLDDGADFLLCNTRGFYAILGGDNPDYEIHAVGYKPFSHRGVKAQYIEPYGDCPDYACIKDGLQRSIRDNTVAGSNGAGSLGITAYNEKGYPNTTVSRYNFEVYARKKNNPQHIDEKTNIPYANAFHLDRMVWATLLFIKFKTKDLHAHSLLGEAISCNDGTVTEETWLHKTGMRTRTSAESAWTYAGLSWDASHWGGINNYKPLLKMFDMQLALSHAAANNIAPDVAFEYDGCTYQYSTVKGCKGLSDGEMTAIVTKVLKSPNSNVEVCLVQPIICGKVAGWGNVYTWTSGIECITYDAATAKYDIYQTNDVRLLTTDADSSEHELKAQYPFENSYTKMGTVAKGEGYRNSVIPNTMMGNAGGGSLHTGECQYNWYTSTASTGKKGRRGVLFGVFAHYSKCALRSANANNSPSNTSSDFGGGFRVSLNTKAKAEPPA